ncbi:MAG: hypothetical protein EZS28_034668 [Streblomastix strix]|uniref:B30.2/SPRY domain-containing protein n=1 Tax=Streblomastix strix TaxID=222440 RepID=A0A5J4UJL2_9EUKA|nr:MAG: hypothetical protein EZS28_034668 [Streblomastix strix]
MENSTYRPDLTAQSVTSTGSDVATIIPRLILDLESDNINLHIPSLRKLLEIIVDNRENKDLAQKYKLMPLLNKFSGNIEKNEEYVLSTTILHVIGIRNGSDDKIILAGAATDSIIHSLFSPDEKQSRSGNKALCELIEENEIIGHSLMTTGFIQKVQRAFTNKQLSSSSSYQTDCTLPFHVKLEVLDVLLKLVTTCDNLQPTSILIPILIQLKKNGEKEIKKKSENIFAILNIKGINATSSDSKEKDEKIDQLELMNRNKDEESNVLNTENLKLIKEIEKIKMNYPQVIPHEFNVANSLTGLGPDILTDLLSEMQHIEDSVQIVGVNKKTLNLKNNSRFIQIIEQISRDKDFPIAIHNPDPSDIDFSNIDGRMKKITKNQSKYNTISLTQVIENGIWEIETEFKASGIGWIAVGIVQDSYNIQAGQHWNQTSMASFPGKFLSGNVYCKQKEISGNAAYGDNQIIKQELNFEQGTLIFFVDGVQQPVYITGIKEKVRFFIYLYLAGSSCTIRSLKKITSPTSKHIPNEKAINW